MLQVDIAKIYNLSPKVVSYYLNKVEGYKRTEGGMSNLT
jgi:predicted transcriptional regulator